nr:MAG TPA: hypothetical protein [Caudoviricetes sp.]
MRIRLLNYPSEWRVVLLNLTITIFLIFVTIFISIIFHITIYRNTVILFIFN